MRPGGKGPTVPAPSPAQAGLWGQAMLPLTGTQRRRGTRGPQQLLGDNEPCCATAKMTPTQLNSPPAPSTPEAGGVGGGRGQGRPSVLSHIRLSRGRRKKPGLHAQSGLSSPETPASQRATLEKGFHPACRQAHPPKILEPFNIPSPPPAP